MIFLALALPARASTDYVTNGDFNTLTNGAGQLGYNTDATGWTTTGYNFVFLPGTADTTGSNGQYGNLSLWGPNNGSNNGLPASSPDGQNFIAMDADFQTAPILQTINGLTAGNSYDVSFYWAASQQYTFDGPTTQQLQVSLGSETQSTAVINLPDQGFSGWIQQTFTFTADSSSDELSFLASGAPAVPPFLLLSDVSLMDSSVPEPGTMSLLLVGLGLIGGGGALRLRSRRRGVAVARLMGPGTSVLSQPRPVR
jgi:hypothetical protein